MNLATTKYLFAMHIITWEPQQIYRSWLLVFFSSKNTLPFLSKAGSFVASVNMIKIGKSTFWFGGARVQFYFLLGGGTAPPLSYGPEATVRNKQIHYLRKSVSGSIFLMTKSLFTTCGKQACMIITLQNGISFSQ